MVPPNYAGNRAALMYWECTITNYYADNVTIIVIILSVDRYSFGVGDKVHVDT